MIKAFKISYVSFELDQELIDIANKICLDTAKVFMEVQDFYKPKYNGTYIYKDIVKGGLFSEDVVSVELFKDGKELPKTLERVKMSGDLISVPHNENVKIGYTSKEIDVPVTSTDLGNVFLDISYCKPNYIFKMPSELHTEMIKYIDEFYKN